MKHMKRLGSLLLAVVLVFAMAIPAFAAKDDHTLTIESATTNHKYNVYQVFDGVYFKDTSVSPAEEILSDITWGTGVNGAALLTALKADAVLKDYFKTCTTAADVAYVLTGKTDNADATVFVNNGANLDRFADVVGKNLNAIMKSTDTPTKVDDKYIYTITGLPDGYYFVSEAPFLNNDDNNAYTKFMLQVIGDVDVKAKADLPTIEKKIDGDNDTDENTTGLVNYNNAAVGDKVPFVLTSRVPEMDGYENYFYVVTDVFSKGLTFNGDVVVKIGTETLTNNTHYTYELGAANEKGERTLTIIFKNFLQHKPKANEVIKITYSATLNQDAVIGDVGNPNTVRLIYSNNPNVDGKPDPGNPDKPSPTSPTGKTPESTTITYTTGINLTKIDGEIPTKKLQGAKFKIEGTKLDIVLVNREIFRENASGTYYRLKDGTYTTTAYTEANKEYYDSNKKYEKVTVVDKNTSKTNISYEGYVNSDGVLTFQGLASGTYKITELVAPNGYNMIKDPITVVINWAPPADGSTDKKCVWTATVDGNNAVIDDNGIIVMNVENKRGAVLPETGGIGTTLFYIFGGLLVVGAIVLLVTKRRMNAAK